jgi:hypothetical protein
MYITALSEEIIDIQHRKFNLYLNTHFRPGLELNSRPLESNLLAARDQRARLFDHLDKTKNLVFDGDVILATLSRTTRSFR